MLNGRIGVQALWPIGPFFPSGDIFAHWGSCKSKMSALSNCSFRRPEVAVGFLLQLSCRTLICECDVVVLLIGVLLMVLICIS